MNRPAVTLPIKPRPLVARRSGFRLRSAWRATNGRGFMGVVLAVLMIGVVRADEESPKLLAYHDRIDQAIDRGLKYLASKQMTARDAMTENRPYLAGSFRGHETGNTGIASLAVMAFLSKGYTPGNGPHGELINHGIDYVLSQQHENGLLSSIKHPTGWNAAMYCHSISTLLAGESSGMVDAQRQARIDEVLPKALTLLLKAQQVRKPKEHSGGWRYQPDAADSDLSLTGWSIMALRAGRLNGAPIPRQNLEDAVGYILKCRHKHEGGFAYQPGQGPTIGLTGCAVLCLELCGEHGHEAVVPACDYILAHLPTRNEANMKYYYALYYCSQATFQLGSKYWETWAPRMYDILLESQQPDGSWPGSEIGETYNTAISVLAMTVSYRQLPIYHRDDSYDQKEEGNEEPTVKPEKR